MREGTSTDPLVSVVMAAFNCESTIGQAIASVLNQTEHRLELIVVDDASSDGTAVIAESFASCDARVRVIGNPRNSRTGPICWEARNDGLRVARGRFVAYLDG